MSVSSVFLQSTGLVALAETGDKTQFLALALAAKHRRPWAVMAGIVLASLAAHALAAGAGALVGAAIPAAAMRWTVGLGFIACGAWMAMPEGEEQEKDELERAKRSSVVWSVALVFLLAEMGDKTQVATIALAAGAKDTPWGPFWVMLGSTMGMVLADGVAVVAGHGLAERLQSKWVRVASAGSFLLAGLVVLLKG